MHVFPAVVKLEQAYPGELVVVGVHSPKFPAEQSTENLRKAVQRLEIEHPVVNDRDMQVWSEYAVRAWPTLILVDPSGKVIGKHEGEMRADDFRPLLDTMIAEFDGRVCWIAEPFLSSRRSHPLALFVPRQAAGRCRHGGACLSPTQATTGSSSRASMGW